MKMAKSPLLKAIIKNNGFTLIELLMALSIVSVMLLLVVPISLSLLERQQEQQFFQTLEFDILYVQSMAHYETMTTLVFAEDHYRITGGNQGGTIRRSYPKGVTIDYRTDRDITFEYHGSIRNPRTILIHTNNESYRMIFPFGKGRYYIEKE